MSDVFYPVAMIESVETTRMDRTLSDEFEDGSTSARYLWPVNTFKRKFAVTHAPLTHAEFRYLRSFQNSRGGYDPFWFRDNVNREGNASVRFDGAFQVPRDTDVYRLRVTLAEVAPIRALPEWDELQTAAGYAPLFWYDANREIYFTHTGTAYTEGSAYDAALRNYPAPWLAGALNLGNVLGQYQRYTFTGAEYAKSAVNVTELSGAQPACTLFAIVRQSTTATKQILFAIGAAGSGTALGLQLNASNVYTPWVGSTEAWATAVQSNGTADTWRSIALVWTGSADTVALYVNGALIGSTSANARSLTAGPVALGASFDGSSKLNPSNAMTNCNVAHACAFAGASTLAQVKAMHNLVGYQYGLSVVA